MSRYDKNGLDINNLNSQGTGVDGFNLEGWNVFTNSPYDYYDFDSKGINKYTQTDVDEVIKKKQPKINSYHNRRQLNELWLLIHTDKYQPDTILSLERSKQIGHDLSLTHNSDFDNVQITCYPSYRMINVQKLNKS